MFQSEQTTSTEHLTRTVPRQDSSDLKSHSNMSEAWSTSKVEKKSGQVPWPFCGSWVLWVLRLFWNPCLKLTKSPDFSLMFHNSPRHCIMLFCTARRKNLATASNPVFTNPLLNVFVKTWQVTMVQWICVLRLVLVSWRSPFQSVPSMLS